MPKVTLDETYSLPDPMLNDNFDIVFNDIPGGGDGRQMRIQCLGASLPGATLQTVEVELFGHKLIYAARKTFSHTMTVALHEIYDARTYQSLKDWAAVGRATQTQTGGFSDSYMRTAILTIYDQTGAEAAAWNIHRMFPTEISEYQFEGAGGQALRQDAQFAYGYVERI
jgi:hypothetical protein